jgi:hypothetical protein
MYVMGDIMSTKKLLAYLFFQFLHPGLALLCGASLVG